VLCISNPYFFYSFNAKAFIYNNMLKYYKFTSIAFEQLKNVEMLKSQNKQWTLE
jgi:hypothetical protein